MDDTSWRFREAHDHIGHKRAARYRNIWNCGANTAPCSAAQFLARPGSAEFAELLTLDNSVTSQ
jgi:hypothetical protein